MLIIDIDIKVRQLGIVHLPCALRGENQEKSNHEGGREVTPAFFRCTRVF